MLFFVTSYYLEAKPIIEYFQLKKFNYETAFPLYRNDNFALIISGQGKSAVQCAVCYLSGLMKKKGAWLNVGIAGASHLPIGHSVLVSKIIDAHSKEIYYPTFLERYSCAYIPVITVEKPEILYANDDCVYDMEASAFFKAALFFSTSELIHCFKVISDNRENPFQKEIVPHLIKESLPQIERVASSLLNVSQTIVQDLDISSFFDYAHFSETEKHQLKKTLQQKQLHTASDILTFLNRDDHVSSPIY